MYKGRVQHEYTPINYLSLANSSVNSLCKSSLNFWVQSRAFANRHKATEGDSDSWEMYSGKISTLPEINTSHLSPGSQIIRWYTFFCIFASLIDFPSLLMHPKSLFLPLPQGCLGRRSSRRPHPIPRHRNTSAARKARWF
jgi:hypothetical protein